MSRPTSPSDGFDITCRCGAVIHTDHSHVGRLIRCRCGEAIPIVAPPSGGTRGASTGDTSTTRSGARRRRRWTAAPDGASARPAGRASAGSSWPSALRLWRSQWPRRAAAFVRAQLAGVRDGWHAPFASERLSTRAGVAYALLVVLGWPVFLAVNEQWVPAILVLYGPRLVVLLPGVGILAAQLVWARRSLLPTVVGVGVALFGFMGLRVALATAPFSPPASPPTAGLRVVTVNAQEGAALALRLDRFLADVRPDVVNVQECGVVLGDALQRVPGWHAQRHGTQCTLSRWPIALMDSMPRLAFQRVSSLGYGGSALVTRARIAHPTQPFDLVNVHLETARKGLNALLGAGGLIADETGDGAALEVTDDDETRIALNARIREAESERAAVWSARHADEAPVIVTGDFNLPVESAIYRRYWRTLTNAFDAKGVGFGYSKAQGALIRIRIDHILVAPRYFRPTGAWLGPEVGSDHRPMIADLRFRD